MKFFLVKFSAICTFILSQLAIATEISEMDFFADEPLRVSSVTRLNQAIQDVPATVTVIDQQMIEASSATTIVELMRLIPGFQVGFKYGNEGTVTYHGLSGETNKRLNVLINGRSTYNPLLGGTLWQSLPITLDDIESIEVVRGPNAATYGANSFSGVINIKTYSAKQLDGTQYSATYSPQRELVSLKAIHGNNQNDLSYRFTFEYNDNSGFDESYREKDDITQTPLLELNDDMTKLLLNSQWQWRHNDLDHNLEVGLVKQDLNFEYGKLAFVGLPTSYKDIFSFYENYTLTQQKGLLVNNKLQVSYNYTNFDSTFYDEDSSHKDASSDDIYRIDLGDQPPLNSIDGYPVFTPQSFISHRLDLDLQHSQILSPDLQYNLGAGLRYDYGSSNDYFASGAVSRLSARFNGHIEWQVAEQLTFNTGGLYEYYENVGGFLSPRIGMNIHLTPNHTIKSNWSQAYRMPTLIDQYALTRTYDSHDGEIHDLVHRGYADIQPEKMESIELGYLGYFFQNSLTVDLRLARETISDVINSPKTVNGKRDLIIPRFRYMNYGLIKIDSAEAAFTLKPDNKTLIKAYGAYANAYGNYAKESNDDLSTFVPVNVKDNADEYVPIFSSGVLISRKINDRLNISAQYNYVDEYTTSGEGDAIERFETFDVKLTQSFQAADIPSQLILTIKNLFDNPYQDFDIDNEVGLEAYIELKMEL